MGKQKLRSKDLQRIGFECNEAISLSLNLLKKNYKKLAVEEQLELVKGVLENPEKYRNDLVWSALVEKLKPRIKKTVCKDYNLRKESEKYAVYGKKWISQKAIEQMDLAMKLPIAVKGALMPDAHVGYGLPIGGVLATENKIIPYAVGLDIGCRMSMSLFPMKKDYLKQQSHQLKDVLDEFTFFGNRLKSGTGGDHPILEDKRFDETQLLRKLRSKAIFQIGSSGSGNHFVEWGEVDIPNQNSLGIEGGKYLGLLSHSGSRGVGATIAQYYTALAMEQSRLEKGVKALAWLDLKSEAGQEYWLAMNLAGDYAKACHDVIHDRIAQKLGFKKIARIENHHNFAWRETHENQELIVHRKGATPANKGELGIIPSSMATPCFIVEGLGNETSLNSASHGSGRKLSRSSAKSTFSLREIQKQLKNKGISLIGGGADEAPQAYKNIEDVMNSQRKLVKAVGVFHPKIVKMAK